MPPSLSTRDEIIQLFPRSLTSQEDCLNECLSLCRLYSLTPSDLWYKFEAYAISSLPPQAISNPTLQDLRALRGNLQSLVEARDLSMGAGVSTSNNLMTPKREGGYPSTANGSANAWGTGSRSGMDTMSSRKKMTGLASLGSMGRPSAQAAQQTPSRTPSALSRGAQRSNGADDSMDMDNSPSRPSGRGRDPSSSSSWTVRQTLNPHIAVASPGEVPTSTSSKKQSRVTMKLGRAPSSFPTRYMFERPGERGEALDDQLETMSAALVQAYGIKEEDVADPSLLHQESVYVIGRICPNLLPASNQKKTAADASNTADVKTTQSGLPRLQPTPTGILLESSKLQGAGQRIPIWFTEECILRRPPGEEEEEEQQVGSSAVDVLGLFPGMILGLKGRNGGGQGFGVEEVLLIPALPLAAAPPSSLLQMQYVANEGGLRGGPLEVVVAAGPFTSEDDLDFGPWHAVMDRLEREPVDVVILLGPFLSIRHPLLPLSPLLPSQLFSKHFVPRLNHLSPNKDSRTAVVLVPSVEDSLTSHASWPQPPLEKGQLISEGAPTLSNGIRCLPNPALFSIGEMVVGVGNLDTLRDLRSEELARRVKRQGAGKQNGQAQPPQQAEDVVARAVRHVLSQRSFYPLFPPPQPKQTTTSEALQEAPLPLSLPHLPLASFTTVTPDLLIFPSTTIPPFAKIVDGTIVIQPGHVAHSSSGTVNVAKMTIRPMERRGLEIAAASGEEEAMEHGIWERSRVDLIGLQ